MSRVTSGSSRKSSRQIFSDVFNLISEKEYIIAKDIDGQSNIIIIAGYGGTEELDPSRKRHHGCYDATADACTYEIGCNATPQDSTK